MYKQFTRCLITMNIINTKDKTFIDYIYKT
jgi:hypothetical protein